jgi:hypothetical protein
LHDRDQASAVLGAAPRTAILVLIGVIRRPAGHTTLVLGALEERDV